MSTSKNRFEKDLNDSFGWISSRITEETIKLRKVERKIERATSDRVVSCQSCYKHNNTRVKTQTNRNQK